MTPEEFEQVWWPLVARWSTAGGKGSGRAGRLLDRVVAGEGVLEPVDAPVGPPAPGLALQCEQELLARSGAFDPAAYAATFAELPAAVKDPLRHFCESGWRLSFNPRSDFDTWWYWSEHLDPRVDRINPLLHHVLVGRAQGLSTLPPELPDRTATRLAADQPPRRACLFAGYDPDGIVDDYVVDYVRELSRHADVFYLADATMAPSELAKLESVAAGAWSSRQGMYDFGSWSRLARDLVGWERLAAYDEVVLANDSAYLLRPLDDVFDRMATVDCDWWGLHPTKRTYHRDAGDERPLPLAEAVHRWARTNELNPVDNLHLSSYFQVFRRAVVTDPGFQRRLDAVARQPTKPQVILKYEIGLSRYLLTHGFQPGALVDQLHPYLPAYTTDYWSLVRQGFPLLKRNLLSENPRKMPDLADWKQRISELVPGARVDTFERNLVRVTADDKRRESFAVRSVSDGTLDYDFPLTWDRFREEDRWAPKFDHWWAFPVCAFDHNISGNERALFEQVRHDPSIKKIVLTRSRPVDLDGENVVVVPLLSREGQHRLARAKQVFVKHGPRVNAHWPASPLTHNFINLWHGIPLKRFGSASVAIDRDLENSFRRNNGACRAVVTSSRLDSLAMTTAFWPVAYPAMWNTGLPRNDYISCPPERLPGDLRAQEQRLRDEVAGRRLVMFLPTFKDGQAAAYYHFTAQDLRDLEDWLARHNAVLGVREHMADRARTYWHQLAPLGSIDLSNRRFSDPEVLYRVADGLISDYSSCLVDFLLTGKPVVSFAYDLDRYSDQERGLFYDLAQVLPGPVCRTFDELAVALDGIFDPPDPATAEAYAWRRRIFFDHVDDQASQRVVDRVKALYGGAQD